MNVMTYEQAREVIQDGDVVFFKDSYSWLHPLKNAILFFTGSPFTHCNMAFWIEIAGQKRLMAVEAQGGTKRRVVNMSFYENRQIVVVKGVKPWSDVASDALSQLAKQHYSYGTAVYTGARDFFLHTFGIKLPKASDPGEICSEFCGRLSGLEDTDISPGDLYKALMLVSNER